MSNVIQSNPVNPTPDPVKLTPEAVIAELRTMQSQFDTLTPLSKAQRALVKQRLRVLSPPVVEASINVIGMSDNVSQAIRQPLDEVRQLRDDTFRWEAAADEARNFLKNVEGANLIRRQRLTLIAMQAYTIGSQLAKDPEKAVLLPHLEEVKRLKGVSRKRKKASQAAPPPAPAAPSTESQPKA